MVDEGRTRQQSEFNSALSYLNRINALFMSADDSAISLDVYTWFHSLLALFRELSTEMTDEEIKGQDNTINQINEIVSQHYNRMESSGNSQVAPELYKMLHDFELLLRKVMKESGLQQKIMDEAAKALR